MRFCTTMIMLMITALLYGQAGSAPKGVPSKVIALEKAGVTFKQVQPFSETIEPSRMETIDEVKASGWGLVPDPKALGFIQEQKPTWLDVQIPHYQGGFLTLRVYQVQIGTPDFEIRYSDGTKSFEVPGVHYRGMIKGDANSLVALSFFDDHVMGFVSDASGNHNLGPFEPRQDRNIHIYYNDRDLAKYNTFSCDTEDTMPSEKEHFEPMESGGRSPGDCVKIWWEVDNTIVINKGSVALATAWMTGVANETYTLYANESLEMVTSVMNVWATPSPYTGNSSSARLSSFQNLNGVLNGDLAHYVDLNGYGGIAAGFSGICNANYDQNMCYSGLQTTYNNVPTYSWTIMVCTHEMGHLLGSRHTHACVWNGNNTAIDGCAGFVEGGCPLPGQPAGGGTIMSYCHQNVGINFNLGFGLQPGNVIRARVDNATCLDNCNPVAQCTFTITCPPTTTVQCGANPLPASSGNPTVNVTSGNCVPTVTYTDNNTWLTGCNGTGYFQRTFRATDGISTVSCVQTINKIDNVAPVINGVPLSFSINCSAPVPAAPIVTASDNCGAATLLFNETIGGQSSCGYTITRTWTATDACNNATVRSYVITVIDTSPPVAICKSGEVFLDQNGEAVITPLIINNGSYDACSSITLSVNPTTLTCANLGNAIVTLIVTDGCNNVSSCNATVKVTDAMPPKMSCQGFDAEIDADGNPIILSWQDFDNGSSDNCGIVEWDLSKTQLDCSNLGKNTIKIKARDASDNESECQAYVTVRDLIPPVFSFVPDDATVYCDENSATDEPQAYDNCGLVGISMVDAQHENPGGPDGSYRVSRLWTVQDIAGNTIQHLQWVTVLAEGQLVVLCTEDITTAPSKAPVQVWWDAPTVDDVCLGPFPMSHMDGPAPGSYFNPGTDTRITYEFVDAYKTRYQCAFLVTVPASGGDYQVVINVNTVDCDDYQLSNCTVSDLPSPDDFSFSWIPKGSKTALTFYLTGPANLEIRADGTARLQGEWTMNGVPAGWVGDIHFYRRRGHDGWDDAGGKVNNPQGNPAHSSWEFFEIDPNQSYLVGTGANAGQLWQLKQSISYGKHGLQLGTGANGVTPGNGGWFGVATFNDQGRLTGQGEFSFTLNCSNTGTVANAGNVLSLDGFNYPVVWSNNVNGPIMGPVTPGQYNVKVTNQSGVVTTHNFAIVAPTGCDNYWDKSCRAANEAVGSTATQGSTWQGAKADRAVDGNTDGDFNAGSVSSTLAGWKNFWQTRLDDVYPIESIRIWPRTDCCDATLDPYYVFVSANPIPDVAPEVLLTTAGIRAIRHEGPMNEAWETPVDYAGQYVKVQLAESGLLQLAEIEVLVCQPDALDPATGLGTHSGGKGKTGSISVNLHPNLNIWPNPGSEQVELRIVLDEPTAMTLTVLNMQGSAVYRQDLPAQILHQVSLDASRWPQGMYMVQAITAYGPTTEMLVIQR